jgi:hypothetical protein
VRVADVTDGPADVEPVGQAAAGELRDERQHRECKRREKPLVSPRAIHS